MTKKTYSLVLLLFSSVPTMAWAQDSSQEMDEVGNEIVVTALRRDTTLQNTPISISALSGEALSKVGATSINDYFRQVPNLQVEGNAPAARRITIRGVRSAGEATVGLYFNETPLTGPGGTTADAGSTNPDVNLFDVERVEVLRGPQGTLFGSGSMGGTIRMIYNKPDSNKIEGAVEGQATVTKNGDPGFYAKGMFNLPIAQDKCHSRRNSHLQSTSKGHSLLALSQKLAMSGGDAYCKASATIGRGIGFDRSGMKQGNFPHDVKAEAFPLC